MSLAEKWEEYRAENFGILAPEDRDDLLESHAQRAFYAGVEAVDSEYRRRSMALTEFETEIENFRSHK